MIVSHNTRGLSSRIKCYLSAKRIDNDAVMIWEPGKLGLAPFQSAFTNDVIVKERGDIEKLRSTWHWYVTEEDKNLKVLQNSKKGHLIMDFMYHDTPKSALRDYSALIQTLNPVTYVKEEIAKFLPNMPKSTFSIRTWKEAEYRHQYFEFKRVVEKIKSIPGDIFLTCDDTGTVNELVSIFGPKIVTHDKREGWGNWHTVAGLQDIVIDLYLGGQVENMYISNYSAFPELQWWFGGCKAKVEVI